MDDHPVIRYDPASRLWTLRESFHARTTAGLVLVMAGFRFDGCSIPRLLWRVVGHPLQGDALPAGVIHDALYASKRVTRETADRVFHELLRRYGVNPVKAGAMFGAVRVFGCLPWMRRRGDACRDARRMVVIY